MSSALEVIFYNEMRYINLRFTYLLTYLLTIQSIHVENTAQQIAK